MDVDKRRPVRKMQDGRCRPKEKSWMVDVDREKSCLVDG